MVIVIEKKYLPKEISDVRINRDQVTWVQITTGGGDGNVLLRVHFPSGPSLKLAIIEAEANQVLGLFI